MRPHAGRGSVKLQNYPITNYRMRSPFQVAVPPHPP